jgi:hypothetical protein
MFVLGILLSVALSASASNCPIVREEFINGNQTSSTGYQLNSYLADDG